jgi:hypothetical protein
MISLRRGNWSLGQAVSEKSTKTTIETPQVPVAGQMVSPVVQTTETGGGASASRLIATVGSLVLTVIMLGIGYAMIWSLFTRGQIPALEGIGPYLMGGAALFAPYAFNQLKEAFKS